MSDLEKVLSKLTEMESSIKSIEKKVNNIESDIAELKTDMKEVKADVDKIKITVGGIQEQTMKLCETVGITEQSIKSIKEITIDNEVEIKTLKRKIGWFIKIA